MLIENGSFGFEKERGQERQTNYGHDVVLRLYTSFLIRKEAKPRLSC